MLTPSSYVDLLFPDLLPVDILKSAGILKFLIRYKLQLQIFS